MNSRLIENLRKRGTLLAGLAASALLAFAALSGVSLASSTSGPSSGPPDDPASVAQAQAQQQAARAHRDSPEGRAERQRSATAYHGQSDGGAIATDREHAALAVGPAKTLYPGRIVSFLDDHSARVDVGSGDTGTVVDSTVPLRVKNAVGDQVPVDLALFSAGTSFAAAAPIAPVRIAKALAGGATLERSGFGLVALAPSEPDSSIVGGAAVWPNAAEDTDYAVRPTPQGFESFAILRSAASPEDYSYRLVLPDSARAVQTATDGIKVLKGADVIATIAPAFARDADGFPVAVTEALSGDVLTLHVAHQNSASAYPITLDPSVSDTYNWPGGDNYLMWDNGGPHAGFYYQNGCGYYLGCGVYIVDNTGAYSYPDTDGGQWRYTVPGYPESQVTSLTASGYLDLVGNLVCVRYGIAVVGSWTAQNLDCGGAGSKSASLSASGGNFAYFQVYMWGAGTRLFGAVTNSATVGVTDSTQPSVVSTSSPSGWTNNTAAPISASFNDAGLGIKSAALSAPGYGSWTGGQSVDQSASCVRISCPAAASVSGTVANLPQGSNTVNASATDRAANVRTAPLTVRVDNTAPTQAISGDGWNPAGGTLGPGSHSITVAANDSYSGVKQIEMKIDAGTGPGGDQIYTNSTCGANNVGCSTSLSHTFTFDSSQYNTGPHTISVTTSDAVGPTPYTASNSETVTFANGNLPLPSGTCNTPLASGYDAGTYVGLWTRQSGSQTVVCVQVANGTTINKDAVFTIDTGSVAAPIPTYDSSSGACSTATPNDVPGMHPEFDVTVLGSQRIMLDAYSAAGQAWVCVQVGSLQYRVMVIAPGLGTPPQVAVGQDTPPLAPPQLTPWPAGPSATCTAGGGTILEDSVYGPESLWLADYQPNATTLDLCLKAQGPVSLGGLLSVNASPSDGVHLVLQQGTSMADCGSPGQPLIDLDSPTRLHVHMSAVGTQPATICIDNGTVRTFTIGVTGSGAPTVVTWTPDAGTPIPPVGI